MHLGSVMSGSKRILILLFALGILISGSYGCKSRKALCDDNRYKHKPINTKRNKNNYINASGSSKSVKKDYVIRNGIAR
jgi:hypothetical protein